MVKRVRWDELASTHRNCGKSTKTWPSSQLTLFLKNTHFSEPLGENLSNVQKDERLKGHQAHKRKSQEEKKERGERTKRRKLAKFCFEPIETITSKWTVTSVFKWVFWSLTSIFWDNSWKSAVVAFNIITTFGETSRSQSSVQLNKILRKLREEQFKKMFNLL